MSITRRQALASAGAAAVAVGLAKPAIATNEPIRIGYLPALTGPSSSTGVGINRGTQLAVQEINAAGGINGRQLELIVRDTQSDPTKAVNASAELTSQEQVQVDLGAAQFRRGARGHAADRALEYAANASLLGRQPDRHAEISDVLPQRADQPADRRRGEPLRGRSAEATRRSRVIGDTTGYGTASVNAYVPMLKAKGADVVYQGNVDATNPDLKPELLRMQAAGAEVIMPWSVNAGFLSRIINTRGDMGWDVPIVGQTTLGSGQTKALLEKPEYWEKVYPNNFRTVLLHAGRQAAGSHRRLRRPSARAPRSTWAIRCCGGSRSAMTAPRLIAEAMKAVGTEPDKVARLLEHAQGLARRLRRHHLHARPAQRLSGR